MVAGLEYVMEVSERHMALCRLLLRETWSTDAEFQEGREMVKARVTSLYVAVLTYQMKCVCCCYHDHPVMTGIRAMLGRIIWKSETEVVRVREAGVQSDACLYNNQATVELLRSIKSDAHELAQISHLLDRLNETIRDANLSRMLREKEENKRHQSELTGRFNVTSYEDQMNVNNLHVKGTCEWFRAHNDFREWLVSDFNRILLVSANPGCGKSVLANYLINTVIPEEKPEATICYYFFKDNAEQSELSNTYSAILHALFSGNGKLADECRVDIEQAGLDLTKRPASLWRIFTKALGLGRAGSVICVLDALDECSAEGLRILVKNLVSLYQFASNLTTDAVDVRFLLTTRGYPDIIDRFKNLQTSCVRLAGGNKTETEAIQKEIDLAVDHRLNKLASRPGFNETQIKRLRECTRRRCGEQRTYIWASLVFDVLEGAYSDNNDRWEEPVNNLPRTAYAAYAKLLEKVQPEEKKRVIRMLHLVLVAFRPLSLQEMNIALNIHDRPGSDSIDDLNMVSDEAFRNWIVKTCGFFITEYCGKVYFTHQTAKEFLLGIDDGSSEEKTSRETTSSPLFDTVDLTSAHASMAESCISYLSLSSCRTGAVRESLARFVREMRRDSQDWQSGAWKSVVSHPFAEYVIRFWPTHFRLAQRFQSVGVSTDIEDGYVRHLVSIFEDFELQHPEILATLRAQSITGLWADPVFKSSNVTDDTPYDSCLLFFADKLGITSALVDAAEVPKSHSVEAVTALFGHLRVLRDRFDSSEASHNSSIWGSLALRRILGHGSEPDSLPVVAATIGRSIPCLEYLISRGLKVDFKGPDGWAPMHWAAYRGYPDVVESLLKHGSAVDGSDDDTQTPLLITLTASNIHLRDRETVARLLIVGSHGRKANLGATTADGHTPLHLAVQHDWSHADKRLKGARREEDASLFIPKDALENSLIKLLVDNGADLNAADHKGQSPLMLACSKGSRASLACLLHSGADPNIPNPDGRSLLWTYAEKHLERFSTSLSPDTANLLLEYGANPNATINVPIDDTGDSMLHRAVSTAQGSKLLPALLRHGADVSARNKNGQTPIHIAARPQPKPKRNRERIITQLLKRGADPNEPDKATFLLETAEMPIHFENGRRGLPTHPEVRGMTPLHWACRSADSYPIRQLLDYGADPTAGDSEGRTPLHRIFDIEAGRGNWGAEPWIQKSIGLLLWKDSSLRTRRDNHGKTPVDLARGPGWEWLGRAMPEFYEDIE